MGVMYVVSLMYRHTYHYEMPNYRAHFLFVFYSLLEFYFGVSCKFELIVSITDWKHHLTPSVESNLGSCM